MLQTMISDKAGHVIFVCRWGLGTGLGHLSRCLALSETLKEYGYVVHLFAPETCPHISLTNEIFGQQIYRIKTNPDGQINLDDHKELIFKVVGCTQFFIVVDDYNIRKIKDIRSCKFLKRVLQFKDMPAQTDVGDITYTTYALAHPDHRHPSGIEFLPIRKGFFKKQKKTKLSVAQPQTKVKLIISFGGVDKKNYSEIIAKTFLKSNFVRSVLIITTSINPNLMSLLRLAKANTKLAVVVDPVDIPSIMSNGDICVGSLSTSSLERLAIGIKSINLITSENQLGLSAQIGEIGANHLVYTIDARNGFDAEFLKKKVQQFFKNKSNKQNYDNIITEQTRFNLANILIAGTNLTHCDCRHISLRRPSPTDAKVIFHWQRELGTRNFFYNPSTPQISEHFLWYRSVVTSKKHFFRLIYWDDQPVGFINCYFNKGEVNVSILISSDARGRGIGSKAICLTGEIFSDHTLNAKVHNQNIASLKLFKKNRFLIDKEDNNDFLVLKRPVIRKENEIQKT